MHKFLKRFLASALLACFPLVFAACGGSSSGDVEMTSISGTAVKGPIKGALIQVFKLKSDGSKGELLGSGVTGSDATYDIPIPKGKAVAPLLVTVSGQAGATYKSESTGNDVAFTPAESFNAAVDTFDAGRKVTVSPLTDAAYQQVQKYLTENPAATADSRVIAAVNTRVAVLFNISDILADPAKDPAYSASLKVIDQMVEDSKTKGATNTLQTMGLINQAFVNVESKSYQEYQTALTSAAATVIQNTNNPAVTSAVNQIVATTLAPTPEPVLTDLTAPNAATNFNAVAAVDTATTSAVTLTWKGATTTGKNAVAGYYVYRNGVFIASVKAPGYVDRGLVPSTSYSYVVITFDAADNRSAASIEKTVITPAAVNLTITASGQLSAGLLALPYMDITPPNAPSSLASITTATGDTTSSVQLTWKAATDNIAVTGYDVYRDGSKIGSSQTASYFDPSVTLGVTYSYTVIAVDARGNRSAASGALSVTPVKPSLVINVGGQISP